VRIRSTIALLVVGAALGGTATASSSTIRSGLYGVVLRGPVRPVCMEGQQCDMPARGVQLTFHRNGRVIARVTTRQDGTYRVSLPAGTYRVTAQPVPVIGRGLTPVRVSVPARFRKVDFHVDTGIQ
jgi:hypothetical protein